MSKVSEGLPHRHLLTLKLNVDSANATQVGKTPEGSRTIAPISGGSFEGDRLKGEVLPSGADWVLFRADGTMKIDVRLTLQTDCGAAIYLTYQGRFLDAAKVMRDLAEGKALEPGSYSLVTVASFEAGDERYSWLNDVIAVGVGEQSGFNPVYRIYEIGGA